jgi:Transcriptional regulator
MTHAADQLNFTQPAITSQIRTLEGNLGISLFERIGKRLYITNAGQALLPYAEKLLTTYDEMQAVLHDISDNNTPIKLGSSTAMASYILPPVLHQFQDRGIKGVITLDICTFLTDTIKGLLDNTYDLVIINDNVDNSLIIQFPLFRERLVWVAHRDLIAKNGGILDVAAYPFINYRPGSVYRSKYEDILRKRNISPALECSDAASITRSVLNGLGIGVLPFAPVAPLLADGTLIEFVTTPRLTFIVSIAFRKSKILSPAAKALLSIFAENANIENKLTDYL